MKERRREGGRGKISIRGTRTASHWGGKNFGRGGCAEGGGKQQRAEGTGEYLEKKKSGRVGAGKRGMEGEGEAVHGAKMRCAVLCPLERGYLAGSCCAVHVAVRDVSTARYSTVRPPDGASEGALVPRPRRPGDVPDAAAKYRCRRSRYLCGHRPRRRYSQRHHEHTPSSDDDGAHLSNATQRPAALATDATKCLQRGSRQRKRGEARPLQQRGLAVLLCCAGHTR